VVSLRPITILLGQNSSGKSTFLRAFPLLRQTVEARTRSPLLWFGRLVDFGGFNDAVYSHANPKEIAISLTLLLPRRNFRSMRGGFYSEDIYYTMPGTDDKTPPLEVSIEVTIAHDPERDIAFTRSVTLTVEKNTVSLLVSASGQLETATINGRDVRPFFAPEALHPLGMLAPLVRHRPPEQSDVPAASRHRLPPALTSLTYDAKRWLHGNTSFRTALGLVRRLSLVSPDRLLAQIKEALGPRSTSFSTWSEATPYFREILDFTVAFYLPQLLVELNEQMARTCQGIRYIEPLRATADRFYRFQDLAVDEIDSQGHNLPMFIHALSPQQLKEYQEWTKEHFGFFIKPERHAGHLSLLVSESDAGFHNLADSGFGYSQILPIATQLWWQSKERPELSPRTRRPETDGGILTMEQPELHLHPRLQAHIADAFVAAVKNTGANNDSFRIVAETHSESIVNRLGELIASGQLAPNDVNIVLFERESSESPSKVSFSEYDEKGYLKNWPFGFFNAVTR
jgi:hypothetical protein